MALDLVKSASPTLSFILSVSNHDAVVLYNDLNHLALFVEALDMRTFMPFDIVDIQLLVLLGPGDFITYQRYFS